MKLYVGNLAYNVVESELGELFSSFGHVEHVRIIKDHVTRQSKNFGYVIMRTREGGCQAMESMNSIMINNRNLVIREARSRDERMGRGW